MFKKLIMILIGSIVSFFCTFKFTKPLTTFTIKSFNNIDDTLLTIFDIITTSTPQQKVLLTNSIVIIFSLILSIILILNLVSIFNKDIQGPVSSTLIIIWSILLVANIAVSIYYILSIILLIALLLAIIFLFSTSSSKGGSVHVKGHYRNGSYVRSHTRRRPRRY